jgi:hypothetical protein
MIDYTYKINKYLFKLANTSSSNINYKYYKNKINYYKQKGGIYNKSNNYISIITNDTYDKVSFNYANIIKILNKLVEINLNLKKYEPNDEIMKNLQNTNVDDQIKCNNALINCSSNYDTNCTDKCNKICIENCKDKDNCLNKCEQYKHVYESLCKTDFKNNPKCFNKPEYINESWDKKNPHFKHPCYRLLEYNKFKKIEEINNKNFIHNKVLSIYKDTYENKTNDITIKIEKLGLKYPNLCHFVAKIIILLFDIFDYTTPYNETRAYQSFAYCISICIVKKYSSNEYSAIDESNIFNKIFPNIFLYNINKNNTININDIDQLIINKHKEYVKKTRSLNFNLFEKTKNDIYKSFIIDNFEIGKLFIAWKMDKTIQGKPLSYFLDSENINKNMEILDNKLKQTTLKFSKNFLQIFLI